MEAIVLFRLSDLTVADLMGLAWLSDLTGPAVVTIITSQFELNAGLVTAGGGAQGCISACA